jgi:hypothetical protein
MEDLNAGAADAAGLEGNMNILVTRDGGLYRLCSGQDNRSYRVCFNKTYSRLPGFKCRHDAAMGTRELLDLFQRIDMSLDVFNFRPYTRLKQLQYLLQTGQIGSILLHKRFGT